MPHLLLGQMHPHLQIQLALEYLQRQVVCFSYIHCDKSLTEPQGSGTTSLTVPQEEIGEDDFSQPEEAELLLGNPSAD